MEQKKIERINELAHKAKTGLLTPQEEREQAELRREYVAQFRANLTAQLENTYIVDENGKRTKLRKRGTP